MAKTVADVLKLVKENEVKFVDFRFTDTRGKEQHVTVPVSAFDEDKFTSGHAFDGSSIAGWKGIEASDMQLMPDPNTANIDPFFEETTMILTCDVVDPSDGKPYERDPRSRRRISHGTTTYTASGTTTSVSTKARSTGCHDSEIGAMSIMPTATSGKIASQVMAARTCTDGGTNGGVAVAAEVADADGVTGVGAVVILTPLDISN